MSPQVQFLKNLIDSAQAGQESAVPLLRQICQAAAEKAPTHDLVTIANCIYRIGIDATNTEIGRN